MENGLIIALAKAFQASSTGMAGKGAMYVHVTQNGSDYKSDKTFAEIKNAYDTGRVIIFVDDVSGKGQAIAAYIDGEFVASGNVVPNDGDPADMSWFGISISADSVQVNP